MKALESIDLCLWSPRSALSLSLGEPSYGRRG